MAIFGVINTRPQDPQRMCGVVKTAYQMGYVVLADIWGSIPVAIDVTPKSVFLIVEKYATTFTLGKCYSSIPLTQPGRVLYTLSYSGRIILLNLKN